MIKSVYSSSRYVTTNSMPASTYVNNYSGAIGVGNVRYNTGGQQMQVYDGGNWVDIQMGSANVGLTTEAESLLDWARKKRDEDYELHELARSNEAVRIAYENLNKAKAQLHTTVILAKEYENETTS